MANAFDLLRSPPVVARSALSHQYLEKILTLSELTAVRWFGENAGRPAEMMTLITDFFESFSAGYHPAVFVRELRSLRGLDEELQRRLDGALDREYTKTFQPKERLKACQRASREFCQAFEAWQIEIRSYGHGSGSTDLWGSLLERTGVLYGLLKDPQLRCRWIP